MIKYYSALFCALLLLSNLETIQCGRFGGRSGGGSRTHSYPSSHGLSGSGTRHSGGLSGGHGYPSSGSNSHGYPSSGGLSGGSSGAKSSYPSSGGLSGSQNHGYPSNHGTQNHGYPASKSNYPNSNTAPSTNVHHHYHYSPPQQISYAAPGHGARSYPVYQGTPPTYVYQYKDSGSKYGTLLAGLALLNLGTLAGTAYAISRTHSGSGSGSGYKPQPGEVCKFAVKKDNGDYEETRIDCQLITSFIFQENASPSTGKNTTTITTSVTNVTTVNNPNPDSATTTTTAPPNVLYQLLPNGTLVPINVTLPIPSAVNITNTNETAATNGTEPSSGSVTVTTTTTTNTTVVNALDVKGQEIQVTPGMECFIIRTTPTTNMRKHISCGLLQTYATQSLKKNSADRNLPTFTIVCAIAALVGRSLAF